MRRLHLLLLAVFAVSAFGAVLVASASAEETLLAEWLVGAKEVTSTLKTEIKGTLLLEDTKTLLGAAAVECTATVEGTVGLDGENEAIAILNAAGTATGTPLVVGSGLIGNGAASGVGSECKTETLCSAGTSASPIEVWPLGLPWSTLLFLMEPSKEILNLIYSLGAAGSEVGYELLCLIGSINTVDECKAPDFEVPVINNGTTGNAETPAGTKATPNAKCSQSGEATGVNETVTAAVIKLTGSTEILSASSGT
jgi:hypothetical protein